MAQPVLARSSEVSTGESFFDTLVDKKAKGEMVVGTISLAYPNVFDENQGGCTEGDLETAMIVTLRMEKDDVLYPFSSSEIVCYFDAGGQAQVLGNFITSVVVPTIFPNVLDPSLWKIKEIRNIAESGPTAPYTIEFLMLDLKIAVQKGARTRR